MKRWVRGMRDAFFDSLYRLALKDKDLVLVTSDTGAICHDDFKKNLPRQYVNIGIAEQNMIGVAAGLAMSGKVVYVYAIVPFATMRCYEQIRVDLCCMDLPVTVVGIGAGFDYSTLGPTHHGTEDIALMRSLPQMTIYSPADSLMADFILKKTYRQPGPKYIRLDRVGLPLIYKDADNLNMSQGFSVLKKGRGLYIISTGRMVDTALKVARKLSVFSIDAGVIDLFKIKPLNAEAVYKTIKVAKHIVTLEEHFVTGGVGSVIAEMLSVRTNTPLFRPIGIPDQFCRKYGTRQYLHFLNRLDAGSVTENIKRWISKQKS